MLAILSPLATPVSTPDASLATPDASLRATASGSRCAALLAKLTSHRPPDCVVFHHIPKTGGGGFSESRVVDLPGLATWKNYQALPAVPPIEATRATLLQGHWTPRFGAEWLRRDCLSVTMLRDAVEHAVSAFYFHGHDGEAEWESCLAGDEVGCGGCCAEQYRDGQTRQLASLGGGTDVYSGALGKPDATLPASALREAKARLHGMDLVGTTTNHAAFAAMVNLLLNSTSSMSGAWTPSRASAAAVAAAKTTSRAHESHSEAEEKKLPTQLVSQIARANSHDAELFGYAAQLEAEDAACLSVPLLMQQQRAVAAEAAEAAPHRQSALKTAPGAAAGGNSSAAGEDDDYVVIAIMDDGVPPFPGTPAANSLSGSR